jgi:PAS domain S-box-containing protein
MTDLDGIDLELVQQLAIPASVHDARGRFVYINPAAERASGMTNTDWVGRSLLEPLVPEARPNVDEQFRRAVQSGSPTDFETVFVDGHGHTRGVRAQYVPIRRGDEVIGVLILAFDVHPVGSRRELTIAPELTRRQREILELVAAGHTTADIARELTLSEETVRNHVRAILQRLQAHTRTEAVAAAKRLGLLAAPPLASD